MTCMFACKELDRLLNKHRFSARGLARELGDISPSTVCRWISGEGEPSFSDVIRLAQLFDVPIMTFCDNPGAYLRQATLSRETRSATVDYRNEAVLQRYFP